jgi:hypothetical protein
VKTAPRTCRFKLLGCPIPRHREVQPCTQCSVDDALIVIDVIFLRADHADPIIDIHSVICISATMWGRGKPCVLYPSVSRASGIRRELAATNSFHRCSPKLMSKPGGDPVMLVERLLCLTDCLTWQTIVKRCVFWHLFFASLEAIRWLFHRVTEIIQEGSEHRWIRSSRLTTARVTTSAVCSHRHASCIACIFGTSRGYSQPGEHVRYSTPLG